MGTTLRELGFLIGYKVDQKSVAQVESSVRALKSTATKILGAIGIGISISQLVRISEEFNQINDKINYATEGLGEQKEIQQAILKAANDTKSSYSSMANIVTKLVKTNKELFPLDDAIEFSSLMQKLLVTAGKTEAEAASLQSTLARTFETGEVRSGVLRRLYMQAPELINTIADSLGVSSNKLYELADNGVLTGQVIKDSIMGAADQINKGFKGLAYTISDAMRNVRNKWGYFVDDLDQTLKVTETIAKVITEVGDKAISVATKVKSLLVGITEKLGGTKQLLKLVAVGFAAVGAPKILSFLKTVGGLFGGLSTKAKALMAIVTVLVLVVEDFMSFLNGKDSFIGSFLGKTGANVDGIRDRIKTMWDSVKQIFSTLAGTLMPILLELVGNFVSLIGNLATVLMPILLPLLQGIAEVLALVGYLITGIVDIVSKLVGLLAKGVGKVIELIFGGKGGVSQATGVATSALTAGSSVVSNSTNSRTVNQYNNFSNTFNGDRVGQQKSAAAMGSASGDAMGEMARALSTIR